MAGTNNIVAESRLSILGDHRWYAASVDASRPPSITDKSTDMNGGRVDLPVPPMKTLFKNSGSVEEIWNEPNQRLLVQSVADSTTGTTIPGRRLEAEINIVTGASVPWTLGDPFKTPWFMNNAEPSGGGAMSESKSSREFIGVNDIDVKKIRENRGKFERGSVECKRAQSK